MKAHEFLCVVFPSASPRKTTVSTKLTLSSGLPGHCLRWLRGLPLLSLWAPALSRQLAGGGVCKASVYWFPPEVSSQTIFLEQRVLTPWYRLPLLRPTFFLTESSLGSKLTCYRLQTYDLNSPSESNMLCPPNPVIYEVLALTALSLENASIFLLLPSLLCSQPVLPGHSHLYIVPIPGAGQKKLPRNARKWKDFPALNIRTTSNTPCPCTKLDR